MAAPSPSSLGSPQPALSPTKEMIDALANPVNLEALLLQLTAPDTRTIATGEAVIKRYLKGLGCVPGLIQQIQGSNYLQVRQLAAMLLRRRLGQLWSKLDANTKEGVKVTLIQCIMKEQERAIRKNIARYDIYSVCVCIVGEWWSKKNRDRDCGMWLNRTAPSTPTPHPHSVMAVAAKRLLGKNKWPELLQFVYQYSQSEVEEQRELAFIILNELAEALGKSFEGQFAQLKQVYQAALHDPRSRKVGTWLGSSTTTIRYTSMR